MHENKKKYLLLSSVNTSVPYPGKSVYFLITIKTTVFLADMSLFAEMNAVYAKYFEGDFPARSAVAVKALPKGALVEIESIAVR